MESGKTSSTLKFSVLNQILPFLIGGISGMVATMSIHPIDTFKVQMQVISQMYGKNNNNEKISIFKILQTIKQQKGLKILYRGIGSALWRQFIYTSVRLGSYNAIINSIKKTGRQTSFLEKSLYSLIAGFLGAIVGTPFDVVLIRRQATITTGREQYKGTYSAFKSIVHDDGIFGLWAGVKITILRVMLINFGQLTAHSLIAESLKPIFINYKFFLDNISAVLASFLTSLISLPADNIKVKLQKQSKKQVEYKGIYDCFLKTVKRQGFLRLWVGFPIYLIRGAPHSFILIRTQQYLTQLLLPEKKRQ